MRVVVVSLVALAAACGIDALGTATDLSPPDDPVRADGEDVATLDAGEASSAGQTDGSTADVASEDSGKPPVACAEPGAVLAAGHCYFPIAASTQPLAQQACLAVGAHLATVSSAVEHTTLTTVGAGDRWIGLQAPQPSNTRADYTWVTDEPSTVAYWYVNDPDNMGPCVALHGTIQEWVDRGCGDVNAAICERE